MHKLGSGNLMSEGGFPDMDADVRSNYLMNTSVMGFEEADAILLIGTNPRLEAPVFNARYPAQALTFLPRASDLSSGATKMRFGISYGIT